LGNHDLSQALHRICAGVPFRPGAHGALGDPTKGLGLNMSVADAYNLAWKLAFVLDDRAGERLLARCSAERQPVGAAGVQCAITSLGERAVIDAAVGLEPNQISEDGWKSLNALYEPGAAGDERPRALRDAIALSAYARLERDGQPLSSLDLVDPKGFTPFTGVGGHSWRASVNTTGGVPVRPDGHAGWRYPATGPDAPQQLSDAIHRALGLDSNG
jgi:hypothetical protein